MHAQEHAAFDTGTLDQSAIPPASARAVIPEGNEDAGIRFLALDSDTPLAWRPYRLHIGARLVLGRTDADGCTARLTSAERAQLTDWDVA